MLILDISIKFKKIKNESLKRYLNHIYVAWKLFTTVSMSFWIFESVSPV